MNAWSTRDGITSAGLEAEEEEEEGEKEEEDAGEK